MRLTRDAYGWLFILPASVLLVVVLLVPAVITLLYSFSEPRTGSFPVILNYQRLLTDSVFHRASLNTIAFVGLSVILHVAIGFSIALLLNARPRGHRVFQVIAILPWTIPDVIAAIVWRWILHPLNGALNDLIFRIGLSNERIEWLSSPALAFPSLIFANAWRGYAFVMLILLAGLQSIPRAYYEAASVDGATRWHQFRFVTLPSIWGVLAVAVALDVVWEVRRFALVKVMTDGGPGTSTEVLSTLIYRQYFQFFRFEYASAMAIILTLALVAVSLPYIRSISKRSGDVS